MNKKSLHSLHSRPSPECLDQEEMRMLHLCQQSFPQYSSLQADNGIVWRTVDNSPLLGESVWTPADKHGWLLDMLELRSGGLSWCQNLALTPTPCIVWSAPSTSLCCPKCQDWGWMETKSREEKRQADSRGQHWKHAPKANQINIIGMNLQRNVTLT